MGFLDAILGRRKPVAPNLDVIFGLPAAAITLHSELGLEPTGSAAVVFRQPDGKAFAEVRAEIEALLAASGNPAIEVTLDRFGFTWLVIRAEPPDVASLVTDLHAVNTTLMDSGFGPQLLCSMVSFRGPTGQALAMVYLFKRGSFYPFAPTSGEMRDNLLELQVRDALADELVVEPDQGRWMALWGAPGM